MMAEQRQIEEDSQAKLAVAMSASKRSARMEVKEEEEWKWKEEEDKAKREKALEEAGSSNLIVSCQTSFVLSETDLFQMLKKKEKQGKPGW